MVRYSSTVSDDSRTTVAVGATVGASVGIVVGLAVGTAVGMSVATVLVSPELASFELAVRCVELLNATIANTIESNRQLKMPSAVNKSHRTQRLCGSLMLRIIVHFQ